VVLAALVVPLSARAWQKRNAPREEESDECARAYYSACSLFATARYKRAREQFLKAAELTTDRKLALRCKLKAADCIFYDEDLPKQERFQQAKWAYEKMLGEYPEEEDLAWAQIQVANSLKELGLYSDAVRAYRAVIARYPGHPQAPAARYQIGQCLLSLGKCEEAREEFEKVLEEHSDRSGAARAAFDIARTYRLEAEMRRAGVGQQTDRHEEFE